MNGSNHHCQLFDALTLAALLKQEVGFTAVVVAAGELSAVFNLSGAWPWRKRPSLQEASRTIDGADQADDV